MLHSLYVSYYSLQSYSSSTRDATPSIRFLLFPVELQQLYRRCYTVYTFPTVPCNSSSTGDATQSILFLLFPVELQQLYRRCYTVYTFPTIPSSLHVSYYSLQSYCTVALQEMLHSLYVSCYSVTVALQEMLRSLYVSYYALQSYRRSTGDATQSIRSLLFPLELQQLYRRCYTVYTLPTIPCRDTVALQEMLHSPYVPYYSLQSYSSSTGDATQLSIRFLLFPVELHQLYRRCYTVYTSPAVPCKLFPVELQQLYRRCYTVYTFPTIRCRATAALQEMLHRLYVSYYSLQSQLYRRCYTVYTFPTVPCNSSSTGDATPSIRFLLFPVTVALQEMLHSLYISDYSLQSYSSSTGDATQSIRFLLFPVELQQLYRRCYTVYTFPTIPCRATVALQEMLHSLYVSYYSLQSYCTVALQEMLHSLYVSYYSVTVALQEMLHSLYVSYYSVTVALQEMLHSLYVPYYSLWSYSPCRATVGLQEMLHSLYVPYYSLQSYSSSTGDATQSTRFLLFPVELQQLYRRCYTVYTFPTIPCRATVALQEMLHSCLYVSYYSLQSYSSSTGDATQSIRLLLFPVHYSLQSYSALQEMLHSLYVSYYSLQSYTSSQEMLHRLYVSYYSLQSQLHRRCYTVFTFPTVPCNSSSTGDATPSIRLLLFPVELQQLYRRCYTVYTFPTVPCNSSSTGDATQSIRFRLFPVELEQLYRRCYTVYTFPTIPCRALQEMLHSLYVSYYSLQRYSSSTGDATQSLRFLLFPVELQQLYRRCYTVYTFLTIPCRATVALHEMQQKSVDLQWLYRRCYTVYTFPTIPCRAKVALQEMLHSLYVSHYSLQSY